MSTACFSMYTFHKFQSRLLHIQLLGQIEKQTPEKKLEQEQEQDIP